MTTTPSLEEALAKALDVIASRRDNAQTDAYSTELLGKYEQSAYFTGKAVGLDQALRNLTYWTGQAHR